MATAGALGRRRAHALQRIEAAAGEALIIPRRSKYDEDVWLVMTIEAIADYFEGLQAVQSKVTSDRQILALVDAKDLMASPPQSPGSAGEDIEDAGDNDDGAQGYQIMTNPELEELIAERGLVKGKARSKHELIAVLEAADKETENG